MDGTSVAERLSSASAEEEAEVVVVLLALVLLCYQQYPPFCFCTFRRFYLLPESETPHDQYLNCNFEAAHLQPAQET